jgi:hypothetical protein
MAKKPASRRLGLWWRSLKVGEPVAYLGTYTGLKSSVCRANKYHAPRQFKWFRKDGTFYVERIK